MSLTVNGGEFVSLLGPSGCGKVDGAPHHRRPGRHHDRHHRLAELAHHAKGLPDGDISFVFQEPTLMPWTTVFGNVYLPLKLRGISKHAAWTTTSSPPSSASASRISSTPIRASSRRHEDARLDRPRAGHQAEAAADGRTLRRRWTRRDRRQKLNDDVLRLWRETGITVIFVTIRSSKALICRTASS